MPDQPIRHLEPLLDNAKNALLGNVDDVPSLNEAIADVNLAHDDFEIETVADRDVYVGGFEEGNGYPFVELAAPDWTLTGFSLGQFDAALDFAVVVRVSAVDVVGREHLYRRLLRYVSAVLDVLLIPNVWGGGVYVDTDRGVRGAYRFDPETDERQDFEGSALLVFYLSSSEVRP